MAPGVTLKAPDGVKVGPKSPPDPQHMSAADWRAFTAATAAAAAGRQGGKAAGGAHKHTGASSPAAPSQSAAPRAMAESARDAETAQQPPAGFQERAGGAAAGGGGGFVGSLRRATDDVPDWAGAATVVPPREPQRLPSIDPGRVLASAAGWGSPGVGRYDAPAAEPAKKPTARQTTATGTLLELLCGLARALRRVHHGAISLAA